MDGYNEEINSIIMQNHMFFLIGDIDEISTGEAIKWIIAENIINKDKDIELSLYINTGGGSVADAFALIDVMRDSKLPIKTIGIGTIHSAGFLIFAAGTPGKRIISKNASIMIHQYNVSFGSKYHDVKAHAREIDFVQERIERLLIDITGFDKFEIGEMFLPPSDVWLSPQELVSFYKIADEVS